MLLRLLILVLATGAAGGAAWLTMRMAAEEPPAVLATSEPAPIQTTQVLVAAGDISGGAVLSPDKLRWDSWPQENVGEGFITRPARPDAVTELTGAFVNGAFAAGEPIREGRLMQANANLLSTKLETGKRAVAVKVTAESTAGGFILPGDRVDVLHTVTRAGDADGSTRNESRTLLSNVRVMAVDQTAVQTPEGSFLGKTATLEVTPAEAELIMAAEASGLLSLALRAMSDHADGAPPSPSERTVRVNRGGLQSSTVTVR